MKRSKLSFLSLSALLAILLVGPASQQADVAVADHSVGIGVGANAGANADATVASENKSDNGERKLILALASQLEGGATATNIARVEAKRESGMGFGQIAHEFDLNLGAAVSSAVSASHGDHKVDVGAGADVSAGADTSVTVERPGKGEIRERVDALKTRIENRVNNLRERLESRIDALRDRVNDREIRGELHHHHEAGLDAVLDLH